MFTFLLNFLKKYRIELLIFCLTFLLGLGLLLYPNQSEFFFLDLQYAASHFFANPQSRSGQIAVIVIDEKTQQQLRIRQGVNFRAEHVRLIEKLKQAGAAVIGFDIAFQTAAEKTDRDFALALKMSGNVIAGEITEQQTLGSLRDSFQALGSLYTQDYWQIPRRILFYPNNTKQKAFAVEIVNAFTKRQHISMQTLLTMSTTWSKAAGAGFWINYKYRPDYFPCFSYIDLLESGPERMNNSRHTPLNFLKDKIVLIGYYQDQFQAPDLVGTRLPGLYVHAYAGENLLHNNMLQQANLFGQLFLLIITIMIMLFSQSLKSLFLRRTLPWLWLGLLWGIQTWLFMACNIWLNYSSLFYSSLLGMFMNIVIVRIRNVRDLKSLNQKLQEFEQFRMKLEELVTLKDSLTNMVFHDIKNYVYSLDTGIKLLEARCHDDTNLRKKLDIIRIASRNIESLSRNLLEIEQLEDGRLKPNKTLWDYERIAVFVQELSRDPLCEINKLQVICEPCPGPFEIYADSYLFERVLHNLFNNAFKYATPGGEVRFTCQTDAEERRLTIFNSGLPLTSAQQERVFDKYYQAQAATAYSKGLGLYFCKQVMEAHEGRMGVESNTHGNSFKLVFKKN